MNRGAWQAIVHGFAEFTEISQGKQITLFACSRPFCDFPVTRMKLTLFARGSKAPRGLV